jgi:hypothetical protein
MLEPDPPVPIRLAVSPSGLGRVSCVPNADQVGVRKGGRRVLGGLFSLVRRLAPLA